jgi:hypothetical protein
MKKIVMFAVCALLFCGGLFCLHLVAQTGKAENAAAPAKPASLLLDPKIEEHNERELLELKVAVYRKFADDVALHNKNGSPAGTTIRLAESHADLAAAEIELYRHTGEQGKLRIALKAQVEALTDKLRAITLYNEAGVVKLGEVCEAEIQLLNALLEQKRAAKAAE